MKFLILFSLLSLSILNADSMHYCIKHSILYTEESFIKDVKYLGYKENSPDDLVFFQLKDFPQIYAVNSSYITQVFIGDADNNYLLSDLTSILFNDDVDTYELILTFEDLNLEIKMLRDYLKENILTYKGEFSIGAGVPGIKFLEIGKQSFDFISAMIFFVPNLIFAAFEEENKNPFNDVGSYQYKQEKNWNVNYRFINNKPVNYGIYLSYQSYSRMKINENDDDSFFNNDDSFFNDSSSHFLEYFIFDEHSTYEYYSIGPTIYFKRDKIKIFNKTLIDFRNIDNRDFMSKLSITYNKAKSNYSEKEFLGIQFVPVSLIIGKKHCFNLDLFSFGTSNALFSMGYAYKF